MAIMRVLAPIPEVSLPIDGWKLLATEAGRYAVGLRATVQLWDSEQRGQAQLAFAYPGKWADFITEVQGKTGCPAEEVTKNLLTLNTAIEGVLRDEEEQAERISQAAELVELAAELELFHTPGTDGEAYAIIPIEQHREVWPLKVKRFRRWLEQKFYVETVQR